eukprot:c16957_g1_i1.p1 GENE.c16957_g1_i1~~c16957_g1_i1.p1  ORF type:complete len:1238 (+),score=252.46 c16957_g1_i1:36-3749(+)
MLSSGKVVVCALAPLIGEKPTSALYIHKDQKSITANDEDFSFDGVFPRTTRLKDSIGPHIEPLVSSVVDGESATLVVFGGRGTGKSTCLMGSTEEPGLFEIATRLLFSKLSMEPPGIKTTVTMFYCELVAEKLRDLLRPQNTSVRIGPDKPAGARVFGASVCRVESWAHVKVVLDAGNQNRTCARKDSHKSHRGHGVIELAIERSIDREALNGAAPSTNRDLDPVTCRLLVVDVASPGTLYTTTTTSQSRTVSEVIPKLDLSSTPEDSLKVSAMALMRCVAALSDQSQKYLPPFGESRLTELLHSALLGDHNLLFIATISLAASAISDSIFTLNCAAATRVAKLRPLAHLDTRPKENERFRGMLTDLKHHLTTLQQLSSGVDPIQLYHKNVQKNFEERNRILDQIAECEAKLRAADGKQSQEHLSHALAELRAQLAERTEELVRIRSVLPGEVNVIQPEVMDTRAYLAFLEMELVELNRQLTFRDRALLEVSQQALSQGVEVAVPTHLQRSMIQNFILPQSDRSFQTHRDYLMSDSSLGLSAEGSASQIDNNSSNLTLPSAHSSPALSATSPVASFRDGAIRALDELNQRRRSLQQHSRSDGLKRNVLSNSGKSDTKPTDSSIRDPASFIEKAKEIERQLQSSESATPPVAATAAPPPTIIEKRESVVSEETDKVESELARPSGVEHHQLPKADRRISWNAPAHAVVRQTQELESLYDLHEELGRGGFSIVRRGVDRVTGGEYALKIMQNSVFKKNQRNIENEVKVIAGFDHPRLVKFREVVRTPDLFVLVTELVRGGELFDKIVELKKFSEGAARDLMWQLVDAVEVLHSNGVLHRDLKPENILLATSVGEKMDIKLTDFGLAFHFEEGAPKSSLAGTPEYAAPEVLSRKPYGYPSDLWSLGVILYILLCGFPPFYGDTPRAVIEQVLAANYRFPKPFWDSISPSARDLVKQLLELDPERRITIPKIREHQWMRGANANRYTPTAEHLREFNEARRRKMAEAIMGSLVPPPPPPEPIPEDDARESAKSSKSQSRRSVGLLNLGRRGSNKSARNTKPAQQPQSPTQQSAPLVADRPSSARQPRSSTPGRVSGRHSVTGVGGGGPAMTTTPRTPRTAAMAAAGVTTPGRASTGRYRASSPTTATITTTTSVRQTPRVATPPKPRPGSPNRAKPFEDRQSSFMSNVSSGSRSASVGRGGRPRGSNPFTSNRERRDGEEDSANGSSKSLYQKLGSAIRKQ